MWVYASHLDCFPPPLDLALDAIPSIAYRSDDRGLRDTAAEMSTFSLDR
jgi:hypothetical protein